MENKRYTIENVKDAGYVIMDNKTGKYFNTITDLCDLINWHHDMSNRWEEAANKLQKIVKGFYSHKSW